MLPLSLTLACGGDDDAGDDDVPPPIDAATAAIDAPTDIPDADPAAPDGAPLPACTQPDPAPVDDGSGLPTGGIPDLIITEINPGDFIEVFNTTDAPIDLATAPQTSYQWCSAASSPFRYAGLNPKIVIPPNSYAVLDWPTTFSSNANDTIGQVALYKNSNFGIAGNMLDFTCWGNAVNVGRFGVAEADGKWGVDADCNASLPADGVLVRNVGTAGTAAADYTEGDTPTPETCTIP